MQGICIIDHIITGCNIEEKFKGLEKARQYALEVEKEANKKTQEGQKGQQELRQNISLPFYCISYPDLFLILSAF